MQDYRVKQGDCLESIAAEHGHDWRQIWDHPSNRQLRDKRKDPNVLFEGDLISIPEIEPVEDLCQTNQLHTFMILDEPSKVELKLLDENDKTRANLQYELHIEGNNTVHGVTTANGMVTQEIPPDARSGRLVVRDGELEENYQLDLGHLDPWDEPKGVQQRLTHLGYECGEIDGEVGPATRQALTYFQEDQGLPETGDLDQATLDKLKQAYGC